MQNKLSRNKAIYQILPYKYGTQCKHVLLSQGKFQ